MRFALRVLSLLAAFTVAAGAHDPAESWTEVIVHADRMEVLVTMAQATALKLIDPANKIPTLTAANFAQHRPRFVQEGGALMMITSMRDRLAVRRVEVALTEELDVAFKLIFPRPVPGVVIFSAEFVKKLPEGFGGIIAASDEAGHQLGWDQVTRENTALVVMLPKDDAPPAKKN